MIGTLQTPAQANDAEQAIFADVRALLWDKFLIAAHDVRLDSDLVGELGIEPADLSYLTLALEEAFDIDIPVEDANQIVRVCDAVSCVIKRAHPGHVCFKNTS